MPNRSVRVLLIDDDADDALLIRALLGDARPERFRIDWVSSYEAGRSALQAQTHDVYLIDYRLGAETGLDLVRAAAADGCEAPLIVLTGLEDRDVDVAAMEAGAADYLIKGQISGTLLERSIRYAIERKQAEQALRRSERRFRAAVEGSLDVFFTYESVRDGSGRIVDFVITDLNARAEQFMRRPRAEIVGRRLFEISPDTATNGTFETCVKVVETRMAVEQELPIALPGITAQWLHRQLVPLGDGLAVTARDISARKQVEARLEHDAFHDALTGLPNRALFLDRLRHALAQAARAPEQGFAVLLLDLDGFKAVNDTLGHLDGDRLLIEVATRLTSCLRPGDTVARFGGDEFAILVGPPATPSGVLCIAERIQRAVRKPVLLGGPAAEVSASIGIALSSRGGQDPDDLLRAADRALYDAKAHGKARAEFAA